MYHRKMIIVAVIVLIAIITVILQMAVFGNFEEMAEVEYEEFQIKIDHTKMAAEVLDLLGIKSKSSGARQKQQSRDSDTNAEVLPANVAPTAPTAPTVKQLYGE